MRVGAYGVCDNLHAIPGMLFSFTLLRALRLFYSGLQSVYWVISISRLKPTRTQKSEGRCASVLLPANFSRPTLSRTWVTPGESRWYLYVLQARGHGSERIRGSVSKGNPRLHRFTDFASQAAIGIHIGVGGANRHHGGECSFLSRHSLSANPLPTCKVGGTRRFLL
jgi:hypothetical protein